MNATTFIIAVALATYAELDNVGSGKGTATRWRHLRTSLERFTGSLNWDEQALFERTMRAALAE